MSSSYDDFTRNEQAMRPFMDDDYQARGHTIVTRKGSKEYDLILRIGNDQRIEEKYRSRVYADLLVEIVQDVVTGDLGWFYKTRCDFLHYIFCPDWVQPTDYWRISWRHFKSWFQRDFLKQKHHRFVLSQQGYGYTLNIAVPFAAIPDNFKQHVNVLIPADNIPF